MNKDIFVRFKFLIMIHTSPITDFKIIIGGRVLVCYYFFSWGGGGGGRGVCENRERNGGGLIEGDSFCLSLVLYPFKTVSD